MHLLRRHRQRVGGAACPRMCLLQRHGQGKDRWAWAREFLQPLQRNGLGQQEIASGRRTGAARSVHGFRTFAPIDMRWPLKFRQYFVRLQRRMRCPILNTHQTTVKQAAMKPSVMPTLTAMCTSAWP